MEDFEPAEPVDLTICLRSFYLAEDRVAFFRRVAGYTRKKFVFDFRPKALPGRRSAERAPRRRLLAHRAPAVLPAAAEALPGAALPLLSALEHTGPLARSAHQAGRLRLLQRGADVAGLGLTRRRVVAFAGVYGSVALGLAASLVVLRVLGPAGAGRFTIVIATADFLALLVWLTSDDALVKYGFRYAAKEEWGRFQRLIRVAFAAELAASLVATALIVAIVPFVDSIFAHGAGSRRRS